MAILILVCAFTACDTSSTNDNSTAVTVSDVTSGSKDGFTMTAQQQSSCQQFLESLAAVDWQQLQFKFSNEIYGVNMAIVDRARLTPDDFTRHPHYQLGYQNVFQPIELSFDLQQGTLEFATALSMDNLEYPTHYKLSGFKNGRCMFTGKNEGANLTFDDIGSATLGLTPMVISATNNGTTAKVEGRFLLQFYHTELSRIGDVLLSQ